ncbi:hypothetical protein TRFO_19475 [Tritrichomonas foetus]|uniref:Suppressor of forked domain-containing protein n=1 Tax=Tritrichomonas foetus TaxID=1144522 RepID=A0A1J4KJ79_9EUKA|nr:hypothetical protein TRFO_19475 [Tritrichomonas foetus]|eukprot:OHT10992.1 hypothetical protein TRFO_19475 [Tritrichomonas foetus]
MSTANLWNLVEKDPYNHYFWTELVTVAEKSKSFEGIVRVYSGFLDRFPLLHVYWNKWALIVYQNNTNNSLRESVEIFEKAVAPGVLEDSVEMWQCYCEFITKYSFDLTDDEVRSTLERAISIVGNDYQSDSIWSIYIHWEDEHQRYDNVSALYARVLSRPIRNLDVFFQNFTEHSQSHSIERAASAQEKSLIDDQLNQEADNDVTLKADDLDRRMQELIYEKRREVYYETLQLLSQRHFFEVKIRRTYFHFTRPNPSQIANWYEYLNYEESQGDIKRIKHLYERCLIPCNMCPDIWIKYANFLINSQEAQPNEAFQLLERANKGIVSREPEFQRLYGLFIEATQGEEQASVIYSKLQDVPSATAKIAVASFYLRCGTSHNNIEEMCKKAVDLLSAYLNETNDPRELTIVTAALAQLAPLTEGHVENLSQKCLQFPLALSLCVKYFVDNERFDLAKRIFEDFLTSPNSKMSLEDKIHVFPVYIDFLRKNGQLPDIRVAERQFLATQRDLRLQKIEERREQCKDTSNLSEVMDRWILYLQETEKLRQGSANA